MTETTLSHWTNHPDVIDCFFNSLDCAGLFSHHLYGSRDIRDKRPVLTDANEGLLDLQMTMDTYYMRMRGDSQIEMFFQDFYGIREFINHVALALAEHFDKKILALFKTFTGSIGRGTGDILTANRLAEIRAAFQNNKIDIEKNPIYVIVNPRQYDFLINDGNYHQYQITGDGDPCRLFAYNRGIIDTPFGIKIVGLLDIDGRNFPPIAITKEAIAVHCRVNPLTMKKKKNDSNLVCEITKKPNSVVDIQSIEFKQKDKRDDTDFIYEVGYIGGFAKLNDLAGIRLLFEENPLIEWKQPRRL